MRLKFVGNVLVVVLVCFGCSTQPIAPLSTVSSSADLSDKETQLWQSAKFTEDELKGKRPHHSENSNVESYLSELLSDVSKSAGHVPFQSRVFLITANEANAYSLPNGAIFVTTTMLRELETEGEVYSVLAHEYSHFVLRHVFKQQIRNQNAAQLASVAGLFLGVLASSYAGIDLLNLADSVTQSFAVAYSSGYSRASELEADEMGIRILVKLGIDPAVGLRVFDRLRDLSNEDSIDVFKTHPKWNKRVASYQQALAAFSSNPSANWQLDREVQYSTVLLDELENSKTQFEFEVKLAQVERDRNLLPILEVLNRHQCHAKELELPKDLRDIPGIMRAYRTRSTNLMLAGIAAKNQNRFGEAFVCFYGLKLHTEHLEGRHHLEVAELFLSGQGVPRDEKRAKYFYRRAASEGNEEASMVLLMDR